MQENSIAVTRGVRFADRDTGPLLMDLYRPFAPAGPTPVVIWLHGGGWFTGDRTLAPDLGRYFGERGLAMASIDYRLSADAAFPAQLRDVHSAVRYLRAHAGRWNVHPERIGLWGSSAGGHLAALAGLTGSGDAAVAAVAESYGPVDLTTAVDGSPEAALLGGPAAARSTLAVAASPIHQVGSAPPPFQISHGSADSVVPPRDSERLHDALVAAGAESTLYLVKGYRHGFLNPAGRIDADLAAVMDDGRLDTEGTAAARILEVDGRYRSTTFGFDDIGDFFVRHLLKGESS